VDRIAPVIGIDFGTTSSKMAWYNQQTRQAQVIKNREGEDETPSVVYFGEQQTLVGTPALEMLAYEEERGRVILSVKRELVTTPWLALPGKTLAPVAVAGEILRKLKADAEALHFHQSIAHAVVTYPASFGPLEQEKIRQAALLAGFTQVEMLAEPVAAALAYTHMGPTIGKSVLIYDLGGGTFDLAILAREEDDIFRLALEAQGLSRCGGDDFDQAIYEHCDTIAQQVLGRPVSLTDKRDLHFLRQCRQRKENLSVAERHRFKSYLEPDAVLFQYELERSTLEKLISTTVEETVRKTRALVTQASSAGQTVDTLVLIGGSSRIPLVQRMLGESLSLVPLQWQYQDVAVALGAVYHAYAGGERTAPTHRPVVAPGGRGRLTVHQQAIETYRNALSRAWSRHKMSQTKVERLKALAKGLALSRDDTMRLEQDILGKLKEAILDQQIQEQYHKAVTTAWMDRTLTHEKVNQLTALAKKLHLSKAKARNIERAVMGNLKETLLQHRPVATPPAVSARPAHAAAPSPGQGPGQAAHPQAAPASPPPPAHTQPVAAKTTIQGLIISILRKFPNIFVYPKIPEKKLANARRSCNVPAFEPILGLIDCTTFGSANNCVLFGTTGIYSHQPRTPADKIVYASLSRYIFSSIGSTVIVSNGQKLSISGSAISATTVCTILREIQQALAQ
jgi:actin-like ATPase involved in cell morphogenesis